MSIIRNRPRSHYNDIPHSRNRVYAWRICIWCGGAAYPMHDGVGSICPRHGAVTVCRIPETLSGAVRAEIAAQNGVKP